MQARFYEKVLGKIEEANELYNISLEINPLEYRALYKLAMESKRKEEYFEAIEFFKRICNILKEKEKENYLQPKEYEYLFKAYLELSRIYGYYYFDLRKYKEIVEKEICFAMMLLILISLTGRMRRFWKSGIRVERGDIS